jgi:hypothetical protein
VRRMTATRRAAALLSVRRRTWILLIVLLALANLAVYLVAFGQCERESGFCAVHLLGTRSEVVVQWYDGVSIYTQTYPG